MLIRVNRSGGFAGLLRKTDAYTEDPDIAVEWEKFVDATKFMEIEQGTELKNWTQTTDIVGRDCFTYWVEADGRTMTYNQGARADDPRFHEVSIFVELILEMVMKKKFEQVRRMEMEQQQQEQQQ